MKLPVLPNPLRTPVLVPMNVAAGKIGYEVSPKRVEVMVQLFALAAGVTLLSA